MDLGSTIFFMTSSFVLGITTTMLIATCALCVKMEYDDFVEV